MKLKFQYLYALLIVAILISCNNDDDTEPAQTAGLTEVTSAAVNDSDYTVSLFVTEGNTLQVGYSTYFLALMNKDGEFVNNAHLSVMPKMTMPEMSHSAPSEEFAHEMGSDSFQEFATVFVMPSGEMGSWTLEVTAHIHDESFEGMVSLPVQVSSPEQGKLTSHDMGDEGSLFISLVNPSAPEIGINDFEIAIHKRENMMSWPAITDYSVTIEPEMPAMGHGSPNNVDPVHDALGHYKGSVNFTMTGEWVVHVTISKGDEVITETDFDIVF